MKNELEQLKAKLTALETASKPNLAPEKPTSSFKPSEP